MTAVLLFQHKFQCSCKRQELSKLLFSSFQVKIYFKTKEKPWKNINNPLSKQVLKISHSLFSVFLDAFLAFSSL